MLAAYVTGGRVVQKQKKATKNRAVPNLPFQAAHRNSKVRSWNDEPRYS
jgi:hypothetical protein